MLGVEADRESKREREREEGGEREGERGRREGKRERERVRERGGRAERERELLGIYPAGSYTCRAFYDAWWAWSPLHCYQIMRRCGLVVPRRGMRTRLNSAIAGDEGY